MNGIFALHLASTVFMTGLIWFVQIVHYPLFARVGEPGFVGYSLSHQQRTSIVVLPAMLTELATGCLLWALPINPIPATLFTASMIALAVIWVSTFLLQVPCHSRLGKTFCADSCRRLVLTNWIRTCCWSVRSLLLLIPLIEGNWMS
ncbi:MAG: hypothetical protein CMJ46_05460 [Planctomyces sp.]|nr:hypothetical protein [Planctomyces sp.]